MSDFKTTREVTQYSIGDGYWYSRKDAFDVEIRSFAVNLDGDIGKQICLIGEYDINGLAFTGILAPENWSIEYIEQHCRLAGEVLKEVGHRVLWLDLYHFQILETLDFLDFTPNLKWLRVECKLKKPYDFAKLSKLEELTVWYGKAFSSIFECTSIRELEIFKMDAYGAENIRKLFLLKKLWIRQTSVKSIDGLSDLKNLERLSFSHVPKMESIASIQECQNISRLSFDCCKRVEDWEMIGKLSNLKTLYMCSCGILNDVNFLKPLENLESVSVVGERMKLVDGKVRWLYENPKIKDIHLPWRKDFDISLEEVWGRERS
ncbi:MAG: hypothetical protein QM657_00570 [Lacrimispora sp.]|uniref:hypothetical protein n=1 Tax=Lacrimispora sp. TaxID=2719234 RepID=UPI0039E277E3